MGTPNLKTRGIEVLPAVLVKTRDTLIESINKVSPYVKTVHIDIMDNRFVPNLTVGLEALKELPKNVQYEFHWMVKNPEQWLKGIKGGIQLVHIEAIDGNWEEIKRIVKENGGKLGLVINPETPVEKLAAYAGDCERILVMAVHPGFSGQTYIKEVENKISFLRKSFPSLDIEVDGGVDAETAASAARAGANKLAAASAIFKAENIQKAIEKIMEAGKRGFSNAHQDH
jgi:ribulose-phosphate 3-epimerase